MSTLFGMALVSRYPVPILCFQNNSMQLIHSMQGFQINFHKAFSATVSAAVAIVIVWFVTALVVMMKRGTPTTVAAGGATGFAVV